MKCIRTKGFTLIELLVVIAIIAILAAILFPVFAQAREKARQATCTSNAKQIMLGMKMYQQDYDEYGVLSVMYDPAAGTYTLWPVRLQPYVKNCKIFYCPSKDEKSWTATWDVAPHSPVAYILNNELSPYSYSGTPAVSDASCKDPSTVWMMESPLYWDWDAGISSAYWQAPWFWSTSYYQDNLTIHGGGSNFGYYDGHAKWSKPSQICWQQFTPADD